MSIGLQGHFQQALVEAKPSYVIWAHKSDADIWAHKSDADIRFLMRRLQHAKMRLNDKQYHNSMLWPCPVYKQSAE